MSASEFFVYSEVGTKNGLTCAFQMYIRTGLAGAHSKRGRDLPLLIYAH
jgi:hypothetical protein